MFRPPGDCPNCGGDVPARAKACPHCGATGDAGWNDEDTRYDGLDLPDDAFEERPRRRPKPAGPRLHPVWILAAAGLLAAMTAWLWMR